MSTNPEAKLFYGYLQPEADREALLERQEAEDDYNLDTAWTATHLKEAYGCIGGIYGYDTRLGAFLAVKASLQVAEWDS